MRNILCALIVICMANSAYAQVSLEACADHLNEGVAIMRATTNGEAFKVNTEACGQGVISSCKDNCVLTRINCDKIREIKAQLNATCPDTTELAETNAIVARYLNVVCVSVREKCQEQGWW